MDLDNFLEGTDGTYIFFFETEGLVYHENKGFIDSLLYDKIKGMMPSGLGSKVTIDNNGIYLGEDHILQPQFARFGDDVTFPAYLLHPNEAIEAEELAEIVLESATELNKELIVASSSKYVCNMQIFMNGDPTKSSQKDIEAMIEYFHLAYRNVYENL
ncbi:MAG: hypothetical protein ACLFNK_04045 [Candidatus Woesearchaeota archaeon]